MRNAFTGYTFQECVTSLFLAKMDVERKISRIEIETSGDHKFDDLKLKVGAKEFCFQIKDIDNFAVEKLKVLSKGIKINGTLHPFSPKNNVLVFKSINIIPDCEILGVPAFKFHDIFLISIDRITIENKIEQLYKIDHHRKFIMERFFCECLDNRKFTIVRNDLPPFHIFQTKLVEPTVKVARNILSVENILHIEGKPGAGKSHLVEVLLKKFSKNIVYKFWISNQDNDRKERLYFNNFLADFAKKLFRNLLDPTEDQIIDEIKKRQKVLIIDGLDHVENYNLDDLQLFINFINKAKDSCKVIILSRPLVSQQDWKKQVLDNWNNNQTKKVLKELYHIQEYSLQEKIYHISDGYPILVRYIAEQYKKDGFIPDFGKFDSIDNYYGEFVKNQKGKEALSLFICSRTFLMYSEISIFLDEFGASMVKEFISEHPYFFDIKLNRISLFHDSFITFLRKSTIGYIALSDKVNLTVVSSLLNGEKRFLSRFSFFELSIENKKEIIRWYSNIENFQNLMNGVIDFEAMQSFYNQLRDELNRLSSEDLSVKQYYDLSLIINLVQRDHLSTLNQFYFTFINSLLFHGYTEDDITSSRYLFAMLYYKRTNDASLLINITSDENFDTRHFYRELQKNVEEETTYFKKHSKALTAKRIKELLAVDTKWDYREVITYILEDLFIHEDARSEFPELYKIVSEYIHGSQNKAESDLSRIVYGRDLESYYGPWILRDVKNNLLSLGYIVESNDYLNLSLQQYLLKNKESGSFNMWVEMLNYIRIALNAKRKIDIESVALFFTKYYQRKDYTLSTIDKALTIFEKHKYVEPLDSLKLIIKVQDVSEKGYRGLLADYILQHPPEIIEFILDNFHIRDLSVSWFELPTEYINVFPNVIYNVEVQNVLKENRTDKKVKYEEVENILKSNRFDDFFEDLKFWRYRVTIPKGHSDIKFLKSKKVPYSEAEPENNSSYSTPDSILDDGVVNSKNKNISKVKKLKSYELAAFSDGWYSALADPDIYKRYGKRDIQKNINAILYNAMLGKVKSINSYHYIWFFPGNVLKILDDNGVVKDFDDYFKSFSIFLELSMYDLKTEVKLEENVEI